MWRVVWRHRATAGLMLVMTIALFGGFSAPSDEDDCAGARIIKDSGMAYYCLFVARAFTDINSPNPPSSAAVPLAFEINLGQADSQFQFLAHGLGSSVYLSKGGAVLDLRDSKKSAPRVL